MPTDSSEKRPTQLGSDFTLISDQEISTPRLFTTNIKTIDELYPKGFVGYGLNLVAGPKGSRKTTLAIHLAGKAAEELGVAAVALAPDAGGSFPLYVKRLGYAGQIGTPNNPEEFFTPYGPAKLMEAGAKILLLDTINLLADELEDGRSRKAREIGGYLHKMAEEHQVIVIGVAHTNAAGKKIYGAKNISRRRTVTMKLRAFERREEIRAEIESHRVVNTSQRALFNIPFSDLGLPSKKPNRKGYISNFLKKLGL